MECSDNTFAIIPEVLDRKHSERHLSIGENLTQNETESFDCFKWFRGTTSEESSPCSSAILSKNYPHTTLEDTQFLEFVQKDQLVPDCGYRPPRGLRKVLLLRIWDWPLYSLLIALVRERCLNKRSLD